jgi:hypothetical protein
MGAVKAERFLKAAKAALSTPSSTGMRAKGDAKSHHPLVTA